MPYYKHASKNANDLAEEIESNLKKGATNLQKCFE